MYEVISAQLETRPGFMGLPDREGWAVIVRDTDTDTVIHFSRLEGEERWYADALFTRGSYPQWVHSFGERAGLALRSATEDLEQVIMRAVNSRIKADALARRALREGR